jgi:hypothetical protein
LTKSQIISALASVLGALSAIGAAITAQGNLFPEKYQPWVVGIGLIGTLAGIILAAFNQSLSTSHVSVPKSKARRVINENPAAAEKLGLVEKLPPLDKVTRRREGIND